MNSFAAVDGGHAAVIWHRFNGGVQNYIVSEGTHFRIPFITYPTIFDIRLRPRVISSRTGTKDLQQVSIAANRILLFLVLFHCNLSSLGSNFSSCIVSPYGRSFARNLQDSR